MFKFLLTILLGSSAAFAQSMTEFQCITAVKNSARLSAAAARDVCLTATSFAGAARCAQVKGPLNFSSFGAYVLCTHGANAERATCATEGIKGGYTHKFTTSVCNPNETKSRRWAKSYNW